MQADITALQYMGMIMSKDKLQIDHVFSMIQILNHSYLSCKDLITILEDIFKNEKSGKILLATNTLQYLVKNCNRNFHQAANKQSFQKSVLGLLKRQRGKMNPLQGIRSNTQNWSRIQSKILYLVQLWYDAFILEEGKYKHIINTYKVLRKQNIVFPPRNVNEKSLLTVQTQSPIFQNIQTIAKTDQQKFSKKLRALGLSKLSQKFEQKNHDVNIQYNHQRQPPKPRVRQVNIDNISQKIAVIRSQQYGGNNVLKVIQDIKLDIKYGKVKPNEEKYWAQVRQAAQMLIMEWEQKNAELVKQQEIRYMESKFGNQKIKQQNRQPSLDDIDNSPVNKPEKKKEVTNQPVDLLGDFEFEAQKPRQETKQIQGQVNLLDL